MKSSTPNVLRLCPTGHLTVQSTTAWTVAHYLKGVAENWGIKKPFPVVLVPRAEYEALRKAADMNTCA